MKTEELIAQARETAKRFSEPGELEEIALELCSRLESHREAMRQAIRRETTADLFDELDK